MSLLSDRSAHKPEYKTGGRVSAGSAFLEYMYNSMSWLGGFILVCLCATGSGRSVLDEWEPANDCYDFRTVVHLIKQCAPSIPSRSTMAVQSELMPSHLRILNSLPCSSRHTMDTCLTRTLALCENREFIKLLVNQTRPLCDGTHLVGWLEDALASLPSVSFECIHEIGSAGPVLCHGQMGSQGFFNGGLVEGIQHSETFLDAALDCILDNMESFVELAPACVDVDIHHAIFAKLMLANGIQADQVIFLFRANHIQQIRERLLPLMN